MLATIRTSAISPVADVAVRMACRSSALDCRSRVPATIWTTMPTNKATAMRLTSAVASRA
jgi:hypothetical protein